MNFWFGWKLLATIVIDSKVGPLLWSINFWLPLWLKSFKDVNSKILTSFLKSYMYLSNDVKINIRDKQWNVWCNSNRSIDSAQLQITGKIHDTYNTYRCIHYVSSNMMCISIDLNSSLDKPLRGCFRLQNLKIWILQKYCSTHKLEFQQFEKNMACLKIVQWLNIII